MMMSNKFLLVATLLIIQSLLLHDVAWIRRTVTILCIDQSLSAMVLDWAIAGQCLLKDTNQQRIVFTHTIDSHGNFNVSDPCPFIPLADGCDLETGAMPGPDVPGNPVTEYEEVWKYLSKDKIGMDEVEKPIAWILESDDNDPAHDSHQGTKTFLARIEGRYLALQRMSIHSKDQSGDPDKIIGGQVSAKSEEFVDGHWRVKHTLGLDHVDLPSICNDVEDHDQHSWEVPGKIVTVRGRRYIVRAFETTEKLSKPTQLAKF